MRIEPIGELETWDRPTIAARVNALIAAHNGEAVEASDKRHVYVAVGRDAAPSGDAYATLTWIIAVCSTEDEALRRIAKAPRLPGSRYMCSVQVWEIDGGQVE